MMLLIRFLFLLNAFIDLSLLKERSVDNLQKYSFFPLDSIFKYLNVP